MISLIMQLLGVITALDFLHPYLLSTQFNAWQGLLREPIDWAPIGRAAWVCAALRPPVAVRRVHRRSCAGTSPAARWLGPCRRVRSSRSSTAACS